MFRGDEDVKHEHCCSPLCVFQLAAAGDVRLVHSDTMVTVCGAVVKL